jgi:hypothetical protein
MKPKKGNIQQKFIAIGISIVTIIFSHSLILGSDSQQYKKQCPCRFHKAQAFATGTCSRSEDRHFCTLDYTATSPTEYKEFRSFLRKLGLHTDPKEALQISTNLDYAKDINFYDEILPIAFAVSQRRYFSEWTPKVVKAIKKNAKIIITPFSSDWGKDYIKTSIGEFNGIISFGCIELNSGNFSTMVKTPWANAEYYCDFKKPEWSR